MASDPYIMNSIWQCVKWLCEHIGRPYINSNFSIRFEREGSGDFVGDVYDMRIHCEHDSYFDHRCYGTSIHSMTIQMW